jgi:hypothetical protein
MAKNTANEIINSSAINNSQLFIGNGGTIYIIEIPIEVIEMGEPKNDEIVLIQVGKSSKNNLKKRLYDHRKAWHYASGNRILPFVADEFALKSKEIFTFDAFLANSILYGELIGVVSCADCEVDDCERLIQNIVGPPPSSKDLVKLLTTSWPETNFQQGVFNIEGKGNYSLTEIRCVTRNQVTRMKTLFSLKWKGKEIVLVNHLCEYFNCFNRNLTPEISVTLKCTFSNKPPSEAASALRKNVEVRSRLYLYNFEPNGNLLNLKR